MTARIDPRRCGCTDCITGYSKPLAEASVDDVLALLGGQIDDATGEDLDALRGRLHGAVRAELRRFLHEDPR